MKSHLVSERKSGPIFLVVRGVLAVLFGLALSYSIVYFAAAALCGRSAAEAADYGYHLVVLVIALVLDVGVLYVLRNLPTRAGGISSAR
jgi:biotin transporter BioY